MPARLLAQTLDSTMPPAHALFWDSVTKFVLGFSAIGGVRQLHMRSHPSGQIRAVSAVACSILPAHTRAIDPCVLTDDTQGGGSVTDEPLTAPPPLLN